MALTGRWPQANTDGEAFRNWILCWVLLPNMLFCATWIVGCPPRYAEILGIGAVGLLVRRASFAVKYTAFTLALAWSLLTALAASFNFAPLTLLRSAAYLFALRPEASPEYLALSTGATLTLSAALMSLRRRTDFRSAFNVAGAVFTLMSLAAVDIWVSWDTRGSYGRVAAADAPFSSAVRKSNFVQGAVGRRHLVLVMVEAMGLPRDAALRRKLMQRWRQPDIARLYEVSTGSTPYFGSTTHGEIRELCGRWGNYDELDTASAARCLPHRLAAKGYETSGMHTFDGQFLDRLNWYPKIGFKSLAFRDTLLASGLAACPGMFPGACDRDVPQLLGSKLKAARAPQFVYWLTLNSHFPIPDDEALGTADCASFDPALAARSPMVCRMFKLWAQTDERLADLLLDPDLPPTDVILVGDHMPPFNDRASRQQFDPERVPWVLLRRRS